MKKSVLAKALGLTFTAVLLTACASGGDVNEEELNQPLADVENQAQDAETKAVEQQALAGEQLASAEEEAQRAAQQALMDVTTFYFDFDQATVQGEAKNALNAHAAYLANNASSKVVLEGHADERGTVEYNLALGERRGMSVRRFLLANGAADNQVEVVSFGEERPAVVGTTDADFAKNRRVELKYQSR